MLARRHSVAAQNWGGARRRRIEQISNENLYWGIVSGGPGWFSRFSGPSGVTAPRNPLNSALLRSVNQARPDILAGRRNVCGLSFMGPKAHRTTGQNGLGSRIPEAPPCCALRTKRGLAVWHGGPISLPRTVELRNGPELSQFHITLCIGELFLEVQARFPDILAQAEWSRAPQAHRIIGK